MKEALKRLLREYNLVSAAVIATIGFAMVMEWISLTEVRMGAALGLIAAWLLVMRFLVTPIASPVLPVGTIVNATSTLPTSVVVEETPEASE